MRSWRISADAPTSPCRPSSAVRDGFTRGTATIDGGAEGGCTIDFQNENLIARADGEVAAIVPDIVSALDAEIAVPITNEALRYGQRVAVLAIRVSETMRSEAALRQFGPAAFGPVEAYAPMLG